MIGAVAPGRVAPGAFLHGVGGAGRHRVRGGGDGRAVGGPAAERLSFPGRPSYAKEVVFDVCGAIDEGADALRRAGDVAAAERLAAALALVEAGLTR